MATLLIGHRGASREAPENTLASFALAFAQGADGIEADFHLTADGEIVCLHDQGTGRTAGIDLPVATTPLSRLRPLDVGGWKGEAFRGERIPTLSEVLDFLPREKMLFIELKSGPAIIPALKRVLAASRCRPERLRILCFDAQVIRAVKEGLPALRACWLTSYRLRGTWRPQLPEVLAALAAAGADGLASQARAVVDPPFVGALRSSGYEIHLWTVDRVADALRFQGLGVDSIMTNRPGMLRRALG